MLKAIAASLAALRTAPARLLLETGGLTPWLWAVTCFTRALRAFKSSCTSFQTVPDAEAAARAVTTTG